MVDFYKQVPKEMGANLEYRLNLRRKAQKDAGLRAALIAACRHDILFFLNAFCFLHEPRIRYDANGRELPKVIPFLTWSHQDEKFPIIRKALGVRNIVVEKCRGEGLSWFMCMAALQDWLFKEDTSVGLVSSTEAKSDTPGNMGSIMAKIDWELTKLPVWMTGVKGKDRTSGDWYRNLNEHSLVNRRFSNQINAFSAGPDVGRGDRFTWFGLDEHASDEWKSENNDEKVLESLGGTTDSILSISTPKGAYGAFHRIMHALNGDEKVVIDWRMNPTKNRGLYQMVDGIPTAVDPINNPLPAHYNPPDKGTLDMLSRLRKNGYDLDSRTRSPWLDRECDRGTSTPQNVAQEIERDYGGSVARVFTSDFMAEVDKTTRPADIIGELSVFDDHTYIFDRVQNGSFQLWCPLDSRSQPPNHSYIVACDVASGDGGEFCSNSALVVVDISTKQQVLEFTSKILKPNDFADKAIAVSKWFNDAFLAWEHGGPGTAFTTHVVDSGYGNIYERTTIDKATRKSTKKVGFVNRGDAREKLFSDLYRYVRSGELAVRSKALGDEFTQYIRDEKGSIHHVSINSNDTSHGDRVIALGVAVQAMKERPLAMAAKKREERKWDGIDEPPPGTIAHILWSKQQSKSNNDYWDDRSACDMTRHGRSETIYG